MMSGRLYLLQKSTNFLDSSVGRFTGKKGKMPGPHPSLYCTPALQRGLSLSIPKERESLCHFLAAHMLILDIPNYLSVLICEAFDPFFVCRGFLNQIEAQVILNKLFFITLSPKMFNPSFGIYNSVDQIGLLITHLLKLKVNNCHFTCYKANENLQFIFQR